MLQKKKKKFNVMIEMHRVRYVEVEAYTSEEAEKACESYCSSFEQVGHAREIKKEKNNERS